MGDLSYLTIVLYFPGIQKSPQKDIPEKGLKAIYHSTLIFKPQRSECLCHSAAFREGVLVASSFTSALCAYLTIFKSFWPFLCL